MAFNYKYRVGKDEASAAAYATKMEHRKNRNTGSFQGVINDDYLIYRPIAGENYVRILPPTWENADHFGIDIHVHYNVGPEKATVICPARMKDTQFNPWLDSNERTPDAAAKCPVCEEANRLVRQGHGDAQSTKDLRPRPQTVVWVVDLKAKGKGPQIWAMSPTVEKSIAALARRKNGKLRLLDHPEDGFNISFDRAGTDKLNTQYTNFQCDDEPSSIEESWLETVINSPLNDCLVWRDYAEINALFEGDTGEADEPAEPVRKPRVAATIENKVAATDEADAVEDKPPARPRRAAAEDKVDMPWDDDGEKPDPESMLAAAHAAREKAAALRARFNK